MNADIRQFDFNGNQLRTLTDEHGEPWFVAKDACDILGISNNRDAIRQLDDDEKSSVAISDGTSGNPNKTIVSEPGLYKLIMRSRKPEAKAFQRWVTHEVLPSIRRHGGYMNGQDKMSPEEMLQASMQWLQSRIDQQQKQLEAQAPKVLFADAVATSKRSILIGEMAKILKQNGYDTGQTRFFKTLREDGYLMKRNGSPNMPTQKSMNLGLFEVKETAIQHSDGHTTVNFTTKVTPKGQQYLISKYLGCTPLNVEETEQ
ncbi:phage antirepressor KilAC domain-containing protein [Bifidobacterium biavatii]|uniref:Phage antirepressor n=1 Tax=Bifidobacterium biavatii DSM 23969 TaxID=1437608 RepID=A0A086ZYY1_9BIFI|nr:phage antirepressor [Bifidobacterium biavatii]KFI51731.1 phage antirepressor [Bifidobacterium biavatii DSM 23969]